jgi:hypothetical protein
MDEDGSAAPEGADRRLRATRGVEHWVVVEVPDPVRTEILGVRSLLGATDLRVPVGLGSVGPLPAQDLSEVRRALAEAAGETAVIIGRFVALRRFPQTRYVYLAPDEEMAAGLLILQDRMVDAGLKLVPDVYQATPHTVIGRVPPEFEAEVAARVRPLVPSPTFRLTTLALWALEVGRATCLDRVVFTGVL